MTDFDIYCNLVGDHGPEIITLPGLTEVIPNTNITKCKYCGNMKEINKECSTCGAKQ
jgi:hypothetical protein